jgi:hypothetical protein
MVGKAAPAISEVLDLKLRIGDKVFRDKEAVTMLHVFLKCEASVRMRCVSFDKGYRTALIN